MDAARLNLRVARISVATAFTLATAKIVAVVATGSLAIAAALADSAMDVVASTVNYFAVRLAGRPADEKHRYGHGKAEGLAGIVQGLVIGLLSLLLLVEGGHRLIGEPVEIEHPDLGIGVMLLSLLGSAWVGWLLLRTARRTGSVALRADAAHYTSDVWMNLGVLVSLWAVRATGEDRIDGVVSLVVGGMVMSAALKVLRASVRELMDTHISEEEEERLLAALKEAVPEVRDVHDVRTRRSGPDLFVDLHASFDRTLSFPQAHRLSMRVVRAIQATLPGAKVTVHADPHPFVPAEDA